MSRPRGIEAAIAALRSLFLKTSEDASGALICTCFHVHDGKIRRAIRKDALTTVEEVTDHTRGCGGCRTCRPDVERILAEEAERRRAAASGGAEGGGSAEHPSER